MRAEVGQHAGAAIAPGRIPDVTRRAVAVEHPAQIDPSQCARFDHFLHAHEVGLETVIVGRVANTPSGPRKRGQTLQHAGSGSKQWLFHQHMLAVVEQVGQQLELGVVRRADQRRIVVGWRHIGDLTVIRLAVDRIDARHRIRPGDGATFSPLNAQSGDDNSHAYSRRRSTAAIFSSSCSGVVGVLPSCSHATAAAIAPRIDANDQSGK